MLPTEEELKKIQWLLNNCELVEGGYIEYVYPGSNSYVVRRVIVRGPIRFNARTDNKLLFVKVRKSGWISDKWIDVSRPEMIDGPWWDVIRKEIPIMEKEVNMACDPQDNHQDFSTNELAGAVSLSEARK